MSNIINIGIVRSFVIGYYKINTFLSDYQMDSVKIPHFFLFSTKYSI